MRLIAEVIRISCAKFHCNRLTTVQNIQDYTSLIFGTHCIMCPRRCFLLGIYDDYVVKMYIQGSRKIFLNENCNRNGRIFCYEILYDYSKGLSVLMFFNYVNLYRTLKSRNTIRDFCTSRQPAMQVVVLKCVSSMKTGFLNK